MNQVSALFKKEWMDFLRNYRLLILATVFFILAFSSPLTAKFMPEILGNFLPKDVADSFPTPTAFDSWQQFFKNFSQIGLFVFVLIFGASLSNERQHGTLVIPLTKGLSRTSVILVKSLFSMIMWTIVYVLSVLVVYGYTIYYWPKEDVQHLFLSVFLLWLFGIFVASVLILGNVLFRSFFGTLLFAVGILIVLFIISLFEKLKDLSLIRLISENNLVLHGEYVWSDYTGVLITTSICIIACHLLAIVLFNRKGI